MPRSKTTRKCKTCGEKKPSTAEYFPMVSKKSGRLRTQCIPCYNKTKREKRAAIKGKPRTPNMVVIDDVTGTFTVYEPKHQIKASSVDVADHMAEFYKYRDWIVIQRGK